MVGHGFDVGLVVCGSDELGLGDAQLLITRAQNAGSESATEKANDEALDTTHAEIVFAERVCEIGIESRRWGAERWKSERKDTFAGGSTRQREKMNEHYWEMNFSKKEYGFGQIDLLYNDSTCVFLLYNTNTNHKA